VVGSLHKLYRAVFRKPLLLKEQQGNPQRGSADASSWAAIEELEPRLLLSLTPSSALLPDGASGDPTASPPTGGFAGGELLVKFKAESASLTAAATMAGGNLWSVGGAVQLADGTVVPSLAPDSLQSLLTAYGVQGVTQVFPQSGGMTLSVAGQGAGGVDAAAMASASATLSRWYRLAMPQDADLQAAQAAFEVCPDVEVAEPNYEYKVADTTPYPIDLPSVASDPLIDQQWYLEDTYTQRAWEYLQAQGIHPGGDHSVIVAVIDTGVDFTHPELAGNIWTNPGEIPGNGIDDDHDGFVDDVHGASVVSNISSHSGDCTDLTGHGTHVAGIIAAQAYDHLGGVGVAFNVQIMAVRAGQYNGTFTVDDIAEGITYAINHGAEVINMSFGGYQHSQIVEDALAMALNQAVLVAAAGNDSLNGLTHPFYPAALPFVHGVQSVDSNNKLSWFSNYNYDMFAPGEGILSTLPGNQYAYWSVSRGASEPAIGGRFITGQ
jgi:subtilisin family serine protease